MINMASSQKEPKVRSLLCHLRAPLEHIGRDTHFTSSFEILPSLSTDSLLDNCGSKRNLLLHNNLR